jgi:tRNA G18 (ribose-2'-O)-methylase SpoU
MALIPPIDMPADDVRSLLGPLRNDVSIAVYNCQNAFSVGAIIRVAHSFLVREVLIIGDAPWYEKASMGMQRFEQIEVLADEAAFLERVAKRPIWAVEKDAATLTVGAIERYPQDVVLVLGSERAGLPRSIVDRADQVLGIPMYGVNHSFPVTVAAGIVLFDWARLRYAPGTIVAGGERRPASGALPDARGETT